VSDRIIVMQARRIVQDGSPRDLYERPANRFVADFIGDATMLAATVVRLDDVMAEVAVGGAVVRLRHFGLATDGLELAVRPQGFRLRPGEAQPGEIAGTVTKSAYLGSHMEYEVRLETLEREVFVIDPDVSAPLAPGAAVGVSILPSAATLVPPTREAL
jgi:iron(III) transport system ATP-binding protein